MKQAYALRMAGRWAQCGAWVGALLLLAPSAVRADDDEFKTVVRPFLSLHCTECHGGDEPESKLALDRVDDLAAAKKTPKSWQKVQQMLRTGRMPPKEQPRPSEADVKRIVDWIDREILKVDCSGPRDPGRVTIRRLNRHEYNNTIRDLVGVEFKPADDFPVDDSGYGFDSIGDVLSVSPLLLEKYLNAAERITAAAIVTEGLPGGTIVRYEAEKLASPAGNATPSGFELFTEGNVETPHTFTRDGRYVLRVRAYGDQAGDEAVKMALRLGDNELATVEVKARGRDPETYETRFETKAGNSIVGAAFLNDFYNPKAERRRDRDRNLVVDFLEVQGPIEAADVKLPETHTRIVTVTPISSGKTPEDCAREIFRRFATRAYRRPPTGDELDRLARLVRRSMNDGESFERAVQLAVQAVLISPHFLFRVEQDQFPREPDRSHLISEFELATRLSYFLWSSTPDDELMELAEGGKLRANLDAQVRRMLADKKSRSLVDHFAGQWLELRKLDTIAPDAKLFPAFTPELRTAMRSETELFFEHVLREDRSVLEFLEADYTFANETLAKHYGLDGVKGSEFRQVSVAGKPRGGVLTHASVLSITSNPTRTSPVKRGKWALEQLLGAPPAPPPPEVPELPEQPEADATASLRQRMEEHRRNPSCSVCHEQMDAIGFALENFDAIGRWRERDGKFAIDASGKLPNGDAFNGPADLKQKLRAKFQQDFVRLLAEKMLTYATGRGVEYYDKCALDDIQKAARASENRFSGLVLAIVNSDPFQKRRAARAEN